MEEEVVVIEKETKRDLNKFINVVIGLIDFSLAIYLVYNLIAMFSK